MFDCFFLFFFLLFLNITRKEDISKVTFLYDSYSLYIPNTSLKFNGFFMKHPGVMSFKCRRSVGSTLYQKIRTSKLYVVLKKIITKGMTVKNRNAVKDWLAYSK